METENRPTVELSDSLMAEGSVVLAHRRGHKLASVAVLTRAELAQFVQQAHDVYGITADPFATPGSADVDARVHTAACPDPCRHDAECPHGKAWTEGETCPACTPAERPNPWLAGLMAGPVNPL